MGYWRQNGEEAERSPLQTGFCTQAEGLDEPPAVVLLYSFDPAWAGQGVDGFQNASLTSRFAPYMCISLRSLDDAT